MNTGKTLFAQLMDFLPWTTFTRIVDRYGGDHRVDAFLREQYRSSPAAGNARHRDLPLGPRIETLSHGLPPAGPALDGRCQRKARLAYPWALAQRLITPLYVTNGGMVYALDSDHRSVPVGLSVGALPHHQRAHGSRRTGMASDDLRPRSCRKPEPSTSWIVATSTLPAFMCCTKPGASRGQGEHRCSSRRPSASFATSGRLLHPSGTPNFCGASARRVRQDAGLHHQQGPPPSAPCRWQVELFFNQAAFGSSSRRPR